MLEDEGRQTGGVTFEVDNEAEYERELFQLRELRVRLAELVRKLEFKLSRQQQAA